VTADQLHTQPADRTELLKLITYYGSHRIFYGLAERRADPELSKFKHCVDWAMQDIERELDRLGVPRDR
jgi:hypothetical protein